MTYITFTYTQIIIYWRFPADEPAKTAPPIYFGGGYNLALYKKRSRLKGIWVFGSPIGDSPFGELLTKKVTNWMGDQQKFGDARMPFYPHPQVLTRTLHFSLCWHKTTNAINNDKQTKRTNINIKTMFTNNAGTSWVGYGKGDTFSRPDGRRGRALGTIQSGQPERASATLTSSSPSFG